MSLLCIQSFLIWCLWGLFPAGALALTCFIINTINQQCQCFKPKRLHLLASGRGPVCSGRDGLLACQPLATSRKVHISSFIHSTESDYSRSSSFTPWTHHETAWCPVWPLSGTASCATAELRVVTPELNLSIRLKRFHQVYFGWLTVVLSLTLGTKFFGIIKIIVCVITLCLPAAEDKRFTLHVLKCLRRTTKQSASNSQQSFFCLFVLLTWSLLPFSTHYKNKARRIIKSQQPRWSFQFSKVQCPATVPTVPHLTAIVPNWSCCLFLFYIKNIA